MPYHMLGVKALEQRVLGGYVSHVKKLHPEAPTPQVYRTDALFDTIRSLRARHGDGFIIDGLASSDTAGGADDGDEWGEGFGWDPGLLDTALAAEEVHESGRALNLVSPSTPAELRARLVEDASTNLLPGFTDVRWWTWAGYRANATLAATLPSIADPVQRPTDCYVRLREDLTPGMWRAAHEADGGPALVLPDVDRRAVHGLKFSAALPERLAVATVAARLADLEGARAALQKPVRFQHGSAASPHRS